MSATSCSYKIVPPPLRLPGVCVQKPKRFIPGSQTIWKMGTRMTIERIAYHQYKDGSTINKSHAFNPVLALRNCFNVRKAFLPCLRLSLFSSLPKICIYAFSALSWPPLPPPNCSINPPPFCTLRLMLSPLPHSAFELAS